MYITEKSSQSRVIAFRAFLSDSRNLDDYLIAQMNRKPYHTFDGKNLIAEYNKLLSERKVR